MIIAYDSLTGNVQRFVNKQNQYDAIKISKDLLVNEPFVLVTYTINFGQVSKRTHAFLQNNYSYMKGVASSGNRNWGDSYAIAADIISEQYSVPLIQKFELGGTKKDLERFLQEVSKIDEQYSNLG